MAISRSRSSPTISVQLVWWLRSSASCFFAFSRIASQKAAPKRRRTSDEVMTLLSRSRRAAIARRLSAIRVTPMRPAVSGMARSMQSGRACDRFASRLRCCSAAPLRQAAAMIAAVNPFHTARRPAVSSASMVRGSARQRTSPQKRPWISRFCAISRRPTDRASQPEQPDEAASVVMGCA